MRKWVPLLLLLIPLAVYSASPDSLYLIPRPKSIEVSNDTFNFNVPYPLSRTNGDEFCAQQLQEAIEKKFKTRPADSYTARSGITLITADSSEFDKLIKAEKLTPPFALGPEGFILKVSPESILVLANEDAGVFYGVQTLIQLINSNSR